MTGYTLRGRFATRRCTSGKRSYESRAAARTAAKDAKKVGLGHMRPYFCQDCDTWHIGHLPRRIRRGGVIERC